MNSPNETDIMIEDLKRSGLSVEELGTRVLANAERGLLGIPASIPGYVIPYWDINGRLAPFYRARIFGLQTTKGEIKYKQPKETSTYIYFPRNFRKVLEGKKYILLTEGEKKASLATKLGYPCVGLGGVDAWRNRIIEIPKDTELTTGKNTVSAKIPSQTEITEDYTSPTAIGYQDLIDLLVAHKLTLVICYDSDREFGVKPSVQRAAADLAFDMRFRGIPFVRIRQLILPPGEGEDKIGLDDFLMENGVAIFDGLLRKCLERRSAFPRHPNIRDYLNKRLQKSRMSRREMQQVSMAILSDMDANGLRLQSEGGDLYYFDYNDHRLMRFQVADNSTDVNHSDFGQFLYRAYGLSPSDHRLIVWLATQFMGEDPLEKAQVFRVFARPPLDDQRIYYQLSDGQYVTVGANPDTSLAAAPGIEVWDNGENGVLFESGQVAALDVKRMVMAYQRQAEEFGGESVIKPWWLDVLGQVRLKDHDKQKVITCLLYYMSPWLYRWRGLQLPVEMILGEPGTGKSTLYELRLNILTGDPRLRNAPSDLKDWHASITNSGGLHVTDNVQLLDKQLRQRLSDEICRIITEPNPFIEMRKYYTEADLRRIPIKCVFGITALTQPFTNADVLQRAIITDLDKPLAAIFDSGWMSRQLTNFGGREAWLAHHLYVIHRFLGLVREKWRVDYPAKHRLIHFEQSMCLMAELFGMDAGWIPQYLSQMLDTQLVDVDWAFEGLDVWANYARAHGLKQFTTEEISNWASAMPEYEKNEILTNGRRLGRYMQQHKSMLGNKCGIVEDGKVNNRFRYKLIDVPGSNSTKI